MDSGKSFSADIHIESIIVYGAKFSHYANHGMKKIGERRRKRAQRKKEQR